MKLFSITLSIVLMAGLTYIAGNHTGFQNGRLSGCQTVMELNVPMEYEPSCSFVDNKLAVSVTDDNGIITFDAETGERIEQ